MNDEREFREGEKQQEDFYVKLRDRMRAWLRKDGKEHKWAEYLMFAPDLFYALVRLMSAPEVSPTQKAKIAGAIAYFVSPIDLIPEAIVGPVGYIDDIALAAYVLDDVINTTSPEVVRRAWPGDDDVLDVIQMIISAATNMLGKEIFERLMKKKK